MNEVMRDNDIFVATLQKPEITNVDLLKNNITLGNTQLLDRQTYKDLPKVQQLFTENGVFNDQKFNYMYDIAEQKYRSMQEDQLMSILVDQLEYSQTSFFRKPTDKVAKESYKSITLDNPLQQEVGLEGLNVKSKATKTEKEVAQSHNIWDPVNKKWLEDSAESRNIFQKAFGESLIYAKYTKDGEQANPITGEVDYHSAGEFIKDADGNYFTQLAGSVDLTSNTEIVKLQDTLSDEDSWWNKIDFFDSDSLEKSIPGTVMKTLVSTIPYFIPYVGPVYTTASILVGLGQNLPQIAKSFDWSSDGSAFTEGCNKVINWFSKYDTSISQHGQEHFWSVEQLGNLTADMVGQLYQQRGLASLSKYFVKSAKAEAELAKLSQLEKYQYLKGYAEEQAKISKALALGYMSLVQAGDVYNDALNAGYSRGVAGLATLMSTGAFFGIMNYNESLNGLGTWFLDKTTGYDREFLRSPIATLAKSDVKSRAANKELQKMYKSGDPKFAGKLRGYWYDFWSKVDDAVRIGGEGMWTNALAEGVEEVSEEVVQDGVKGLIDGLNYLGYTSGKWGNPEASFGGWSNVFSQQGLERYIETFVGGAFGGAMFNVTQNKIKPFTDSLFGIESDVPKPVSYDHIDIAIRGLGDEYNKEVDRAVKFVQNRELDLSNPEDAKIYNAREAIATTLKNEMKVAQDLVDGILKGANFSTLPADFREQVKFYFKPMISQTGALNYVEKKFERNVEKLADLIRNIQEIEKDISENKEGLDIEKARADLKAKKEQAKSMRENVIGYFTGKSYIDTHDEAQWLTNKDLFNSVIYAGTNQAVLSDKEYYETVMRSENNNLKYEDLIGRSEDPSVVTKESVSRERQIFLTQLQDNFDESQLEGLYDQLPIVNKAFKAMVKLIGPSITAYSNDAAKRTIIANAIKKMSQERDILKEALESEELLSFLQPEVRQEYETASEERRAEIEQQTRESIDKQIVESFSIQRLIDLIKKDPNSFSLQDRYNIDYATILESKGVITWDDKKLTPEQKQIMQTLINSEFANVPLSTLTKENVQIILDSIQGKLSSDSNYFGQLFKEAAKTTEGTITENVQFMTFDVNIDKFDDTIEFVKLSSIEDFINTSDGGLNTNLISEDLYNYLLEFYLKSDSKFLDQLINIDSDLDDAIKSYLNNSTQENKQELITALKDVMMDLDLLEQIREHLNIQINQNPTASVDDQLKELKDTILEVVNKNLKAADFIEQNSGKEKVENNFAKAIEKIGFSIGATSEMVRLTTNQLTKWAEAIRKNQGLSVDESLSLEDINHMKHVLQIFSGAVKTMAPAVDLDGNAYEGIQQRNKNFAKSLGQDDSDYYVISSEEYDLFQGMMTEMQHKLDVLRSIYENVEEEQSKQFIDVRNQMIANEFKMFRYHIALPDDPLYIESLAEEINSEEDKEFSIEEQFAKTLQYRQAVFAKLHSDAFGDGVINDGEDAVIKYLMESYGKTDGKYEDSVFYYGDPATLANNQVDGNNTQSQYLLNELIGLAGLDSKYNPKTIQSAIEKAFEDTKMYPREDQIYAIQLALQGILAKNTYSIYGKELANWYNDPKSRGAIKTYIENLIRIPGPAGSGKTSLYSLLIKSLENLGVDTKTIITAQSSIKISNIQTDLKDASLKNTSYNGLYDLISNLNQKNKLYRDLEYRIFSYLTKEQSKILKESVTINVDDNNVSKGQINYKSLANGHILVTVQNSDFDLTVDIPTTTENGQKSATIGDAVITFNSFDENIDLISDITDGLLVIDECTNLSPFEWFVLGQLSAKHGFNIVATGDQYQRGYSYKHGNNTTFIGDDNILGLNIPSLVSVHRALSSANKNNEQAIRNIAIAAIEKNKTAIEKNKKESHEGLKDYHYTTASAKIIESELAGLKLQYTLNNQKYGLLGADITSTEQDFLEALKSIKEKNSSILVITANDSDVEKVQNLLNSAGLVNVKFVKQDDVQGAEADYAIAYNIPSVALTGKLNDLKEIYTLVTRGRYGFISYGNSNDLFNKNKVTSTTDFPVVVIAKGDLAEDKWLDTWKSSIEQVKEDVEVKQPKQSVPETPEEETNEPDSEELDDKEDPAKTSTNIKDAFGENAEWLIMRQYGYYLGISLKNINEQLKSIDKITNDNTTYLLNQDFVKGTSFGAFLMLLQSKDNLSSKLHRQEDSAFIQQELSEVLQQTKDLPGTYIEAYIRFINRMREASENGLLNVYSFQVKQITGSADEDNSNVAYLKVNDEPEKATSLRTIGIPVFSDDNISGHIILGTLGYDTDEGGESSISKDSWYHNLSENITLKVFNKNPELIQSHQEHLATYYKNVGFKDTIQKQGERHSGPVAKLTNLRDFKIVSDWQGNISSERTDLGRATLEEFLNTGYEIVSGEVYEINPKDTSNFVQWYNKFRFGKLGDKLKLFEPLLKHPGTFIVVRPKGTSGSGHPILIKQVVDWNTFIDSAKTEKGYINSYAATNIFYALGKFLNVTDFGELSYSSVKEILLGEKQQSYINTLADKISKHPTHPITQKRSQSLLTNILNSLLVTDENAKKAGYLEMLKTNDRALTPLINLLNDLAPEFPYISATSTEITSNTIVERVFEQSNNLIDLSLLSDPGEQNIITSQPVTVENVVTWGDGLDEDEKKILKNALNCLSSISQFNAMRDKRRLVIDSLQALVPKLSKDNITQDISTQLLNAARTLSEYMDEQEINGDVKYEALKRQLVNMSLKADLEISEEDLKQHCKRA